MKSYSITVDGKVYDVTVEEKAVGAPAVAAPAAAPAAPAPAAAAPVAPAAPAPAAGAGSIPVEAGAAGKVFKITASVGASLSKGDEIMVLEVMKMETPVVAPEDGVLKSIEVSEGQTVEAGLLLATME